MDRAAKALARTGFKSLAVWGLEAQGLAPTTLRRPRAQVAGMPSCEYLGRCATMATRLAHTEEADPRIFGRLQLFKELRPQWAALTFAREARSSGN